MTDLAVLLQPTPAPNGRTGRDDVLAAIRGNTGVRPPVDPGLSGGLREWLEDGLCSLPLDRDSELVVTKQTLRGEGRKDSESITSAIAIGALMHALFRQYVTTGRIEDPMEDGLASLELDPRRSATVRFVHRLGGSALHQFRDELETQTAILVGRWPRLSPGWMPRTQERVAVPLAGGNVVLAGVIDLVIGSPSSGQATVGLVEAKSGRPRLEDRDDLRFYALLETLRSGAPPFRVATFYTRSGQVDAEDVYDELLASCVMRVLGAIRRDLVGHR